MENLVENIVTGKLYKTLKQQTPAKPWGPKHFFTTVRYSTHPLEGYVPKPESKAIPSRPTPAKKSVGDQSFLTQKDTDDQWTCFDLTVDSYSLGASQITDHEALNRKTALSMSENFFQSGGAF